MKRTEVSIKRVCLIGAESTGKTTLAEALALHFKTVWAREFARDYLEPKMWVCQWEDMIAIARGQARLEDEMIKRASRVLFCDTDAMTTSVWCERYFDRCDERILRLADERKYDLYFLCDIDFDWVDDGTRDSRHLREWFHRRFLEEIESRHLHCVMLSGSIEERMRRAIAEVERLIEGVVS
jgi:NadR type nicotinamide-nucleotide adenylyltransferase